MQSSSLPIVAFNPQERRAAAGLAAIFALRMLGLFLILPVFALRAGEEFSGATPLLIGLAMGAYGLTQALLQIPLGMLSDRIGRKPVIFAGLALFALGSLIAGFSESISGVILGRVIQGSGAIAAAIMALTADLTREAVRTRAMAGIGMSIGGAFGLALVLGPMLAHWGGVRGIFWLTAILAVLGMGILAWVVPDPTHSHRHRDAEPVAGQLGTLLRQSSLLRLDGSVLLLHMLMTALFLVLPLVLREQGLPSVHHWQIYLPVLALSMGAMIPFIIQAEGRGRMKAIFVGAVAALLIALLGLYGLRQQGWLPIFSCLFLFFTAFNLLEATLPSMLSKLAPVGAKGTAMGIFSTAQFSGAFLGGLFGGWAHQYGGENGVFLFAAAVALLWLFIALGLPNPPKLSSHLLPVSPDADAQALQRALLQIPGVEEALVVPEEETAYLKLDKQRIDWEQLERRLTA